MISVAKRPCGSCPYRKDVPSGIWAQEEYDKLPAYDGPTAMQDPHAFMCHQRTGNLCAGWLACHGTYGPTALIAVRLLSFFGNVSDAVWDYVTDVPVFKSGAEAREHGMRDIDKPGMQARKLVTKLTPVVEASNEKRRRKR